MLRSLLSAQGVSPQMITVFIDGYYEVSEVWELPVEQSTELWVPSAMIPGDQQRRRSGRAVL